MSTNKQKAVVTYELLPEWERKQRNAKESRRRRKEQKQIAAGVAKAMAENEERLALKKAIREEIRRTHVIPASVFQAKLAQKREKEKAARLKEEAVLKQKDAIYREMLFEAELQETVVVPIEVIKLPSLFKKMLSGYTELLEYNEILLPVLVKFSKIVGFHVKVESFEGVSALCLYKPFPHIAHLLSYSDSEKRLL